MKKIFVLFLALMLVFSTAVTASADTLTLDSDTEQMLIKAYKSQHKLEDVPDSDIEIDQYYGTMNDGSILIKMDYKHYAYTADIKEVVIGDYLFTYSGCHTTLYKDGNIYEIVAAYKKGIINNDTLDQIASVLKFKVIGCTTELDSELEYKIKNAYRINLKFHHNITTDIPLTDIKVHYYKTLSDESMLVLCESKYLEYSTDIREETIGKYIYSYSGNHILLFRHNSLDEIKFAYDKNIIDDTVLDEIAETLNFKSAISEETTATENTNPTETQNNSASSETKPTSSNGAIATGDNNTVMFISIFTVLTFTTTVVLIKRKKVKA